MSGNSTHRTHFSSNNGWGISYTRSWLHIKASLSLSGQQIPIATAPTLVTYYRAEWPYKLRQAISFAFGAASTPALRPFASNRVRPPGDTIDCVGFQDTISIRVQLALSPPFIRPCRLIHPPSRATIAVATIFVSQPSHHAFRRDFPFCSFSKRPARRGCNIYTLSICTPSLYCLDSKKFKLTLLWFQAFARHSTQSQNDDQKGIPSSFEHGPRCL